MAFKKFVDYFYHYRVHLGFGESIESLNKYCKKINPDLEINNLDKLKDAGGCMFEIDPQNFIIWTADISPKLSLLAHECFHLTHKILSIKGMVFCNESEEAFAYLHQYLFEKIFELS